ncbi:hypothetical protein [Pseudomonas lopnurensis]|uniref:hypothetical protein n=1 Tax=Pseudomonas lopnurensis TaxID=1477517 RepID=UPI0028AC5B8E|nr:hypothetical protein [Pseudomonas lopnurensis]
MSLQAHLVIAPSFLLHGVALLCALCGGWLLLATRWREQRAATRLLATNVTAGAADAEQAATIRLNRLFYRVGFAGLALALAFSWGGRLL